MFKLVKLNLVNELFPSTTQVHVAMEPGHRGSERDGVQEKDAALPEEGRVRFIPSFRSWCA